jgi:hypothetical protein
MRSVPSLKPTVLFSALAPGAGRAEALQAPPAFARAAGGGGARSGSLSRVTRPVPMQIEPE